MNERPGKLPVSGDRCAEVELQARPIMPLDIHSLRKKEERKTFGEEGGQRFGPTQLARLIPHPPRQGHH